MGPDGGLLKPGVIDLVNDDAKSGRWQPRGRRTSFLVLGAEACREIVFSSERFDDEGARKRILKNLTVPVSSLMDVVLELHASLNDDESRSTRSTWSTADQDTFTQTARRLKKVHSRGPVRKIRHTLAAHLDPDIFGDDEQPLRCDDILLAMGNALVLFGLSLNHRARAFSWIRAVGSFKEGSQFLVETMVDYPACVRWITDADGRVMDLAPMVLAADPRLAVQEQLQAAIQSYNSMIRATGTQLPPISWKAPVKHRDSDDTKELHINVLLARKTPK